MGYDESYAAVPDLFGKSPDPVLLHWPAELDRSRPVLDIGGGQGRNALHLAGLGHDVELLDPSEIALRDARAAAAEAGLTITTRLGGFESISDADCAGKYGTALVFGVIQVLTVSAVAELVAKLRLCLAPSGRVFITAFTTGDNGYKRRIESESWTALPHNSFRNAEGAVRTFLLPNELARLFEGWKTRHYREALGPVHRHGDGEPEQHAMVEAVFELP